MLKNIILIYGKSTQLALYSSDSNIFSDLMDTIAVPLVGPEQVSIYAP